MKLKQFKYLCRRMEDLTQKNHGIRGKASEVERQLRDRVLQVCCEEQMAKLSRQEAGAVDEKKAEQFRAQQEDGEDEIRTPTAHTFFSKSISIPFSEASKRTIKELGNNELHGLGEISERVQCPSCSKYSKERTIYCLCGICLMPSLEQQQRSLVELTS